MINQPKGAHFRANDERRLRVAILTLEFLLEARVFCLFFLRDKLKQQALIGAE
jgi:hypothetical protein